METRLYIGNMSPEASEQELRAMFTEAGTIAQVELVMDRQTGKPKGFGFITMSSLAEAEKAINLFDTKDLHSRPLKVNLAKPREDRPVSGGNHR
uniref:RNA-binding protein n=1 Tax=Anaerolinea thermolimosa TaxID=229919 RepID=A0A7C4KIG1_9CHLR